MRRPLAVSLAVLVLPVLLVGCGGDDDEAGGAGGSDPTTTTPATSPPVAVSITPLTVELRQAGQAPLEVLEQDLAVGSASEAQLDFTLVVEGVSSAEVSGQTSFDVRDVDAEGTAGVGYALSGLDVAVGTGPAAGAEPIPDALDITGELTMAADRGVTAATVQTQTSGQIPGIETLAASLDPRLTSLLLPFPTEPVGVGAEWTVNGPLPLFGAVVDLTAQLQLVERRQGQYVLTADVAIVTPQPDGGTDLTLRGLGRLTGDIHQVALRQGRIGFEGNVVLPDGGPDPQPMSLELSVDGT